MQNDSLFALRFDPYKKATEFKDSLKQSGVDTLLLVIKECNYCIRTLHKLNNSDSIEKQFLSESEPAYLFWCKNGRYFVKKIDQFFSYQTVERATMNHYPLYDFYSRNKMDIAKNNSPRALEQSGKKYISLTKELTSSVDFDRTYIEININSDCSKTTNITTESTPVFFNNDSITSENSAITYYDNFMLKRNEWQRIIDSELFILECKNLWIRE